MYLCFIIGASREARAHVTFNYYNLLRKVKESSILGKNDEKMRKDEEKRESSESIKRIGRANEGECLRKK